LKSHVIENYSIILDQKTKLLNYKHMLKLDMCSRK